MSIFSSIFSTASNSVGSAIGDYFGSPALGSAISSGIGSIVEAGAKTIGPGSGGGSSRPALKRQRFDEGKVRSAKALDAVAPRGMKSAPVSYWNQVTTEYLRAYRNQ